MTPRTFSIAAIAGGCCVSIMAPAFAVPLIETSSLRETVVAELTEPSKEVEPAPASKTLAGKVLTAIALERVTGRKPDPTRFSDLN